MIPLTGEMYARLTNSFDIQRGMPPGDVLNERVRFVTKMHWYPEGHNDDRDEYDSHMNTYHFTRRDENGSIIAAMRLTPIESIGDSLSFSMISENPEMQSAVNSNQELATDSAMWDLTRLIYPLDSPRGIKDTQNAMIELFGMAARASVGEADDGQQNIHWVFTTTPAMMRFFQQAGINCEILAAGKLVDTQGKPKTTLFCRVDVASAIEALSMSEEHKDTYLHLQKGVMEAEVGLVYA